MFVFHNPHAKESASTNHTSRIILILHAELASVRALLVKGFDLSNLPSTLKFELVCVCLRSDGFFVGDQVWDEELFSSRGMQLYEILYAFELYALLWLFSLLSIAGDPVTLADVMPLPL